MSKNEIVLGMVSTIIPVHNRPLLVREAVNSVLMQTYRPIEIILVNDGSTDETAQVLRTLTHDHRGVIRVIDQPNRGPGSARETGRGKARGEFIQYLDSDDLLLPRKFELQVKGLRKYEYCDVSYGRTRLYQFGNKPEDVPWKRTGERIATMFPSFLQSRWWSTSTPLYRRQVVERAGPWTSLWNEEDWEYDCRVAALGVSLHCCCKFVSDKRVGQEDQLSVNGSRNPTKLADRAKAHELILAHALRYGMTPEAKEMRHFSRELFLLSRQCGAAGLGQESERLFELARRATEPRNRDRAQFRFYGALAQLFGWVRVGQAACAMDKLKSPRRDISESG